MTAPTTVVVSSAEFLERLWAWDSRCVLHGSRLCFGQLRAFFLLFSSFFRLCCLFCLVGLDFCLLGLDLLDFFPHQKGILGEGDSGTHCHTATFATSSYDMSMSHQQSSVIPRIISRLSVWRVDNAGCVSLCKDVGWHPAFVRCWTVRSETREVPVCLIWGDRCTLVCKLVG